MLSASICRRLPGSSSQVKTIDMLQQRTLIFVFAADSGKSSFMAGFSMGFMAFALKKLLLPVFLGAQLVKSVLIAMFLPSIIGSLGKLLGKGLSSFSGLSGASAGGQNNQIEDFEFKDTSPYNNEGDPDPYPPPADNSAAGNALETATTSTNSR